MRDTIYLGYHPEAKHMLSSDNEPYGERFVPYDTSYFNAGWSHMTGSSSRNVRVASLYEDEKIRAGNINFYKAVYPVYAYWDVNRLRSDSLPFENEPFSPRSALLWYWDSPASPVNGHGNPVSGCGFPYPIVIADTTLDPWCSARHGLTFGHTFISGGIAEGFNVAVRQYEYPPNWWTSLERLIDRNSYYIYPNPVEERLILLMDMPQSGTYKILNLHGQIVQRKASDSNKQIEFIVKELSPGSYWLWAEFENGETLLEQFIVSH